MNCKWEKKCFWKEEQYREIKVKIANLKREKIKKRKTSKLKEEVNKNSKYAKITENGRRNAQH